MCVVFFIYMSYILLCFWFNLSLLFAWVLKLLLYSFSPLYRGARLTFSVKKGEKFGCTTLYLLLSCDVSVGCTASWFLYLHSLKWEFCMKSSIVVLFLYCMLSVLSLSVLFCEGIARSYLVRLHVGLYDDSKVCVVLCMLDTCVARDLESWVELQSWTCNMKCASRWMHFE